MDGWPVKSFITDWEWSGRSQVSVLDNYHPHLREDTASLAESMDTDLGYVPGGCTGIAQPCLHLRRPFRNSGSSGGGRQQQRDQTGSWFWRQLDKEKIPRDLDDSDDEADESTYKDGGDVDDLDPFSDSDD